MIQCLLYTMVQILVPSFADKTQDKGGLLELAKLL